THSPRRTQSPSTRPRRPPKKQNLAPSLRRRLAQIQSLATAALIFGSSVLYAIVVLNWLHEQFHTRNSELRKKHIFRIKPVFRVFKIWKAYHLLHHLTAGNYTIGILLWDIVCGTFVWPSRFMEIKRNKTRRRVLFPGYNSRLARGCNRFHYGGS
ncbi:MAG TPA: hypothetical protein VEA59_01070, partial [Patescibacteria group bacterium]|nr:hypothetical protein [Patescibacteria group bacterium]